MSFKVRSHLLAKLVTSTGITCSENVAQQLNFQFFFSMTAMHEFSAGSLTTLSISQAS
jgi:hypothetical protein